ncbi:hypothetical protein [Vibrio harveyi]|uniref:hypothetical protein n=1 Tax=Vibrio harveyi TaxID=669 RepID=UPI0025B0A9A2|nr:hypothetical protein [Vibrio harveyi]WJT09235.1 hypothetical protein PH545_24730 [Vibrio harveyi]
MKFENVKKGDTVYVVTDIEVSSGWGRFNYGSFFLPCKVTNVTPKMFDIERISDKRFMRIRKVDGYEHKSAGNRHKAFLLGDEYSRLSYQNKTVIVSDQTAGYNEASEIVKLYDKVRYMLDRVYIDIREVTKEQLQAVLDAVAALPREATK